MSVFVVSNCNLPDRDWEILCSTWSKADSIVAIAVVHNKRGRVLFCNSEVSAISEVDLLLFFVLMQYLSYCS